MKILPIIKKLIIQMGMLTGEHYYVVIYRREQTEFNSTLQCKLLFSVSSCKIQLTVMFVFESNLWKLFTRYTISSFLLSWQTAVWLRQRIKNIRHLPCIVLFEYIFKTVTMYLVKLCCTSTRRYLGHQKITLDLFRKKPANVCRMLELKSGWLVML